MVVAYGKVSGWVEESRQDLYFRGSNAVAQ